MSRVALLNSGGIDSRVTAAMLAASGMEIHSLFIEWTPAVLVPSRRSAAITAEQYCTTHETFPWPYDWTYRDEHLGGFNFPQLGLLVHAVGTAFAVHIGSDFLASGMRREGKPTTWHEDMQKVMAAGVFSPPVSLLMPIFNCSADEVSVKAAELGVELGTTWSCYASDPACGTCKGCARRQKIGLV